MWNMAYVNREESKELKLYRSLDARMELSAQQKNRYYFIKKGYDGEVYFDLLAEKAGLDQKFYILNDLLLKCDGTLFQIDSLMITQHSVIVLEIKNYEYDYYFKVDNFYSRKTNHDVNNPLHQLDRIQTLLRKLLRKIGLTLHVEGYVIFINPNFFLYQAPLNDSIVYHSQLNRFIGELADKPSELNNVHRKLADFLLKENITDHPIRDLPTYSFNLLRKDLMCACCHTLSVGVSGKMLVCSQCNHKESLETAIVRCVEELRLLFPEEKIKTSLIHDWCRANYSRKVIRKILLKHYNLVGYGKWSYYE